MSFAVKKLAVADDDAAAAALWYEERQPGLGSEFLDEVESSVQLLAREALQHRIRFHDVRRTPIRRFRFYGVYYVVEGSEVWVIAVHHGRRHPRHLQKRRERI